MESRSHLRPHRSPHRVKASHASATRKKGKEKEKDPIKALRVQVQTLEDMLIKQNNRIVALEGSTHSYVQDLIIASVKELKQAGKLRWMEVARS
jgi:hypothetical protein